MNFSDGAAMFGIYNIKEEKFSQYTKLLLEWNEKINLTAITDPDEIISKHYIDSISCQEFIPQNASVIDVGTGAGFPGIPLKIVRDDLKVTLLDSLEKRIKFLNEVISSLNLSDISTIHSRAEDGGSNPIMREKFDIAVSRAVASLPVLCEYCLPFVKVGGKFIALKGPDAEQEVSISKNALGVLGGEILDIRDTSFDGMNHKIVIIGKKKETPAKYPRKAGKVSKAPL